jgi:hypothetical protein
MGFCLNPDLVAACSSDVEGFCLTNASDFGECSFEFFNDAHLVFWESDLDKERF